MARKPGHECCCEVCRSGDDAPEAKEHRQLNALLDRLDEQQRRWGTAREAVRRVRGGFAEVAMITGLPPETIRRGRDELNAGLADRPSDRIRQPGGGRPRVEKKIRQ